MSTGDDFRRELAQQTTNLFGAMLRIDVLEVPWPFPAYNIPEGNAFLSASQKCGPTKDNAADCPEIYAWGFRNPWRWSFDSVTGDLWLGDVGEAVREEVNVVVAGGNYGWNVREGAHCFNPPNGCANTFVEPISEYDHGLGQSVTGGSVYRGAAISELLGWYVFGDFVSGRLFGFPEASATGVVPIVLSETTLQIVSFGRDSAGEIYLLNFGAGNIHQIVDAP